MKGSYVIIIFCQKKVTISIGKLGLITFSPGFYVYVGSALNGLEQRISRHVQDAKNNHWHIDYLLDYTTIREIYVKESTRREECDIAQLYATRLSSIPGFGCSDCHCTSHLFYGSYMDIKHVIEQAQMNRYLTNANP